MKNTLPAVLLACLGAAASLSAGPISALYAISAGGIKTGYIIQGSSSTSFDLITDESAIAVVTTARVLGASAGQTGREYTLAGVNTGTVYNYPGGGGAQFYDGTTDGTNNYSVDYYTGDVYRFDLDWTNPSILFSTGQGSVLGITWDGQNNSLWIGSLSPKKLTDYTLNGTLLSSFNTTPQLLGLAFDPADGTLWGSTDPNVLYQYSTSGTLLDTITYTAQSQFNSVRGLEFSEGASSASPEPGTWASSLGAIFLLAMFAVRRGVARP